MVARGYHLVPRIGAASGSLTAKIGTTWMILTMPFVLYAVFRYTYLVEQRGEGGAPDETFLKDVPTRVTVGLYVATTVAVLSADRLGWLSSVL
jgi:hypothetical protein